jgi:hypothetical protein
MYTKTIKFQRFVKSIQEWVDTSFKTTDDAIWLHLNQLELDKNVRKISVEIIEQ